MTDNNTQLFTTREEFDNTYNVRTDGQAHTAAINVDDMPTEDLQCAATHPALHWDICRYASFCLQAREYRTSGHIATSLHIEAKMNTMWENLPQGLRW